MSEKALKQMESLLDSLVVNASELKQLSTGTVQPEELEGLQAAQEGLIADLVKQDHAVQQLGEGAKADPCWGRIQAKMDQFSELNEAFIKNLAVRKGLIQFEIQEVKKTRQSLSDMKVRYSPKAGDGKSRINELS